MALAALGLLSGLVPTSLESLVDTATESLRLGDPAVHLALWHGPTTALVLSALAICTGALLFVERRRIERAQSRAPRFASAAGSVRRHREGRARGGRRGDRCGSARVASCLLGRHPPHGRRRPAGSVGGGLRAAGPGCRGSRRCRW
ncbi:MAG: hypothetical protein V9E94_00505 [Microthrixaceae bacterium]